jgi:hypothetical protein
MPFVKRLHDAGFTDALAEMLTALHQEVVNATLEQVSRNELASKHDIRELELKIEVLRSDLQRDIAESKSELIRWIIGAGFLQTALITALLLKLSSGI